MCAYVTVSWRLCMSLSYSCTHQSAPVRMPKATKQFYKKKILLGAMDVGWGGFTALGWHIVAPSVTPLHCLFVSSNFNNDLAAGGWRRSNQLYRSCTPQFSWCRLVRFLLCFCRKCRAWVDLSLPVSVLWPVFRTYKHSNIHTSFIYLAAAIKPEIALITYGGSNVCTKMSM